MASESAAYMLNTSVLSLSAAGTTPHPHTLGDSQTEVKENSIPKECINIRSSEMGFLPWNNSENIVTEQAEFYARRVRFCSLIVLFLIGVPSNVINMIVFFNQNLRDRVNLLLFSLALADLLFLAANMLTYGEEFTLRLSGYRQAGPTAVFIVNNHLYGIFGFGHVSLVLSAIVACERCYCVFNPLKCQTALRTTTTAVIIVAAYVVVMAVYFVSKLRYHYVCAYHSDTGVVSYMLSHDELYLAHKDLIDYLGNVVFGAGLAAGMPTVLVSATVLTVIKLRQAAAWRMQTSSSLPSKEIALTKMLLGTSALLIVCITPHFVFRIVRPFLPELNTGRRHQNFYLLCLRIVETTALVNCSFNIFIYYRMGSRYRETFWALLKRRTRRTREEN